MASSSLRVSRRRRCFRGTFGQTSALQEGEEVGPPVSADDVGGEARLAFLERPADCFGLAFPGELCHFGRQSLHIRVLDIEGHRRASVEGMVESVNLGVIVETASSTRGENHDPSHLPFR